MMINFGAPPDALAWLVSVKQPFAVLIGAEDEVFRADQYAPLIHGVRPECRSRSFRVSITWGWSPIRAL